jgi:membrane-associated phospholipid phosphatase
MAFEKKARLCLVLWLLAGTAAVILVWPLDNQVDTALTLASNSPWHRFAWWCSELAEGWVPALVGISLAILFLFLHRPSVAARIFFVALTCELTGLTALILRVIIGRTRPTAHDPQGFYGFWHNGHWIIGRYEFSSFPSGHSATAVGLAAAVWLLHRGWGAVAALYALLVMWSRIALQCHHLSDVIASTFLAIPLAVLFKKVLLPFLESQFSNLDRAIRKA